MADLTVAPLLAAIDIGGTTIKSALLTEDLTIVGSNRMPTPCAEGPAAVPRAVVTVATSLRKAAFARTGRPPSALGVASLGLVDETRGRAVSSTATGWQDLPLAEILAEQLGIPVGLCHDIRAAADAEARLGRTGGNPMLFTAIGTGIGAAIHVEGSALRGARSRAAELGHVRVAGTGRPCACGGVDCLEVYASGAAIATAGRIASGRRVTARDVATAAAGDEPWACDVWGAAVDALAEALCTAAVVFDPAVIVIGGGVSLAGNALLAPVTDALARRFPFPDPPPVRAAVLGDEAALLGAALAARELAS